MAGSGNWIGLGSRPLGDRAVSIQDETPQNLELAERPRSVDKDHTLKTHLAGDRVRLRPTGLDRFTYPVRWERQMHAPIRVDVGELASGEDDTGPHVGHAFVEPQAASPRNRDDRRPVLHACRLNARRNSSALTSATGVTPIWVCAASPAGSAGAARLGGEAANGGCSLVQSAGYTSLIALRDTRARSGRSVWSDPQAGCVRIDTMPPSWQASRSPACDCRGTG